jgi:hypothetical protein
MHLAGPFILTASLLLHCAIAVPILPRQPEGNAGIEAGYPDIEPRASWPGVQGREPELVYTQQPASARRDSGGGSVQVASDKPANYPDISRLADALKNFGKGCKRSDYPDLSQLAEALMNFGKHSGCKRSDYPDISRIVDALKKFGTANGGSCKRSDYPDISQLAAALGAGRC